MDAHYFSDVQPLTIRSQDGEECHGFYYPSRSATHCGPEGQKPPLLVICHGGPSGVTGGAQYLADRELIDKDKLIIPGSSAGGYTVVAALTFTNTFSSGASLYGIGDLSAPAEGTHKFEPRALDSLIGPCPKQKVLCKQRSPIHHIEQFTCPVIFLQSLEDKIVPPAQAEKWSQPGKKKHFYAAGSAGRTVF